MFAEAIVRAVPATIEAGITSAKLGKPDYEMAREQHDRFVGALERGYEVIELEMSEFRKLDGGLSCLSLRLPAPGGGS